MNDERALPFARFRHFQNRHTFVVVPPTSFSFYSQIEIYATKSDMAGICIWMHFHFRVAVHRCGNVITIFAMLPFFARKLSYCMVRACSPWNVIIKLPAISGHDTVSAETVQWDAILWLTRNYISSIKPDTYFRPFRKHSRNRRFASSNEKPGHSNCWIAFSLRHSSHFRLFATYHTFTVNSISFHNKPWMPFGTQFIYRQCEHSEFPGKSWCTTHSYGPRWQIGNFHENYRRKQHDVNHKTRDDFGRWEWPKNAIDIGGGEPVWMDFVICETVFRQRSK